MLSIRTVLFRHRNTVRVCCSSAVEFSCQRELLGHRAMSVEKTMHSLMGSGGSNKGKGKQSRAGIVNRAKDVSEMVSAVQQHGTKLNDNGLHRAFSSCVARCSMLSEHASAAPRGVGGR